MRFFVVLLLTTSAVCLDDGIRVIHVGALFQEKNYQSELAFRYSVSRFNLYNYGVVLEPFIEIVSENDSFKAGQIVCDMAKHGIFAIFGPDSPKTNDIVQSIAETLEIPQFQTFWNPKLRPTYAYLKSTEGVSQVFNLYPEVRMFSTALFTVLRELRWKNFAIIYQDDDSLIRLQNIFNKRKPDDLPITIKKLDDTNDHRPLLKDIKKSGEFHIILDCNPDKIIEILLQAQEVKLLESYHSWLITSLDTHTQDFYRLKETSANITAIRLLDPTSRHIRNAIRDWEAGEKHQKKVLDIQPHEVLTQTALLYDAVNFFLSVFTELDKTQNMTPTKLSCDGGVTSNCGYRFTAHGKNKILSGNATLPGPLSGPLSFDDFGRRKQFTLQVIEWTNSGFKVTATWNSTFPDHLNLTLSAEEKIEQQFHGKLFRVVSRLGAPYLMERKAEVGQVLRGNERFEGYTIELIDAISKVLNFTYEFELVPDNNYGNYDPTTKEWNGLIRHILDRKAELAICDLTITYERRKAVDFTTPFMTLGISILYSKPQKPPPKLFSFMEPLSFDIWIYTATAYLGMSLVIFLIARLTPRDWQNPHPCNPNPQTLENIWDVKNCYWLSLGSIMAQGCDLLPKGTATRMITVMWWFFCLIMTQSYTANMAAFLTMDRMGSQIENAEDLAKQTKVKYGSVLGGATGSFFQQSNLSLYQRMWSQMVQSDPTVFEKSNADGVKRVLSSKGNLYAFIMESSSLEYQMERNCELTQIGSWLDAKGYGIAMPLQSPYRSTINAAVLKMQEDGTLHKLKKRWWKEMYGGGKCQGIKESTGADAAELKLANVGGVFLVLLFGVIIAFFIAALEFLWNVRKVSINERLTFRQALRMEMRFVANVKVRQKAVKLSSKDLRVIEESEPQARKASSPFMHINVLNP